MAHEMTPTYPELKPSFMDGVWSAELELFNKRSDVHWYELGVFTEDWEPIPFVSKFKVVRLDHLARVKFDVYIGIGDVDRAEYVCSKSKLRENINQKTLLSSRICSRFKG